MQKLTQVSDYDIWYLDNFYDDPDQVRNLALSVTYESFGNSSYPGIRCETMELNKKCEDNNLNNFYSYFLNLFDKKISILRNVEFDIQTSFHKIPVIHSKFNSVLNTGYIHTDLLEYIQKTNKKTFAGVIYLNKDASPNSGTSIFKLKGTKDKKIKLIEGDNFQLFESSFEGYDYENLFSEYTNLYNPFIKRTHWNYLSENKQFVDSKFEKVLSIENFYNRLVLYDSTYFHTASNFYVNDYEDRLTQPFFIQIL